MQMQPHDNDHVVHHPPGASPLDLFADPSAVISVLWRGRRMVLGCVLVCFGIASAYLIQARRYYQATAKILVLEQGGAPLSGSTGVASGLVSGPEDDIPTHAMLVSSPVVLRRAVESVGVNNLPSINVTGGVDAVVRALTENLSITRPDRQAKILQIAYRSPSPEESVRVVKAVAESYKAFLEEVYAEKNSEVVVLMARAQDDLSKELKDLEKKYLEFRQQTPYLTGDGTGRPFINQRIDEWGRAARDASLRAVQLKAQLELGRQLSKEGIGLWSIAYAMDQVGVGGPGSTNTTLGPRTQNLGPAPASDYLRLLSTEQQQLAERLGPQSTKVKELQERIAEAQAQSRQSRVKLEETEIHDLLGSIDKSLKSIETMRGEIQTKFDDDMVLAKRAEIDQLADQTFKSELQRRRTLYDSVVEQLKRSTLVGGYSGTRSQIVEPPYAQPKPVRPLVSLTLGMALATGAVLGVALALGAELIDPRVRSAAEARRVLRLPMLGQVPFVDGTQSPRNAPIGLICQAMPRSPSAEAYRVVRANLDLARRNQDVRVVMVSSPEPGEGKSTVATNLAVALAQAGRRVLLIDADLRAPSLHQTFNLSRERGLVHVLRELVPLPRVIQTTSVKNLDLIASGPESANPAELLSSSSLSEAIAAARETYDSVVIDVPSLLSVADSSIVGAVADAVVLVVRIPSTRRADASRAVEVLKGLGTPVLGVVINGAGPEPATWSWPSSEASGGNGTSAGGVEPLMSEIPYDPRVTLSAGVASWGSSNGHEGFRPPNNNPMEANGR